MKLRYYSTLDLNEMEYPGVVSSALFLAGGPIAYGYYLGKKLPEKEIDAETGLERELFAEADTRFFYRHFRFLRKQISGVVFSGGEPLKQANALLELCSWLKRDGFLIRINTPGYYAEELRELLNYVDCVSLDVKTKLDAGEYARAAGFGGDKALLLSKILKSITFVENAGWDVRKEFVTTIISGVNDSVETIEAICKEISFADQYVLKQYAPEPGNGIPLTPKEKMEELAAAAKKIVRGEVSVQLVDKNAPGGGNGFAGSDESS